MKTCEYCGNKAEIIYEVNPNEKLDVCKPCMKRIDREFEKSYEKALGKDWRDLVYPKM